MMSKATSPKTWRILFPAGNILLTTPYVNWVLRNESGIERSNILHHTNHMISNEEKWRSWTHLYGLQKKDNGHDAIFLFLIYRILVHIYLTTYVQVKWVWQSTQSLYSKPICNRHINFDLSRRKRQTYLIDTLYCRLYIFTHRPTAKIRIKYALMLELSVIQSQRSFDPKQHTL